MFDTLFWMILVVLILITECVLLIAYVIRKKGFEESSHAESRPEASKECAFFFGYLSEQPTGKPIPEECFGCMRAVSCMKAAKPPNESSTEKQAPIPRAHRKT